MVLSSVDLIPNIGLITAYALTGEPNEKDPTFNKEHLTDNDEVDNILIGDSCVQQNSTSRKVILERQA